MTEPPAPRRARHLMDPANPRPAPSRPGGMGIEGVQKWVLSALAATTVLHLSVGIVVAAIYVDASQDAARIGLNVIASAFGVIAFALALAIHRKSLLSPWLLLGLVPGAIGLWICYG